ncbi:MAG TPA: ethylbenzene dehydrogenase-related protein, partial [Gemmatimonadaceae bacterium]
LALRVSWDDRSQSPDSAWDPFTARVLASVAQDDSLPPGNTRFPDQLAVQFPRTARAGAQRPYFLMGSPTDPVYQWRWTSGVGGGPVAGLARGIDRFEPIPGAPLAARAVYEAGQWRVVLTRSLAASDTVNQLQFRPEAGGAVPMAFFVWDGSNGETGTRMAVSTWYYLALDTPVPARVFISPIFAAALTFGLGLLLVRRTQRRAMTKGG